MFALSAQSSAFNSTITENVSLPSNVAYLAFKILIKIHASLCRISVHATNRKVFYLEFRLLAVSEILPARRIVHSFSRQHAWHGLMIVQNIWWFTNTSKPQPKTRKKQSHKKNWNRIRNALRIAKQFGFGLLNPRYACWMPDRRRSICKHTLRKASNLIFLFCISKSAWII